MKPKSIREAASLGHALTGEEAKCLYEALAFTERSLAASAEHLETAEARVAELEAETARAKALVEPWFNDGDSLADTVTVVVDAYGHMKAASGATASVSALPPTGDAEPCYDLESCTGCRDHRPSRGPVLPREAKPALSFKLRVVVDDGSTFTVPVLLDEGEALSKFDIVYAREGVRATVSFEPTPAVMGVPTGSTGT